VIVDELLNTFLMNVFQFSATRHFN